ncbi:MAG: PAS domain-containing protein [Anaerolineales bacterium]|nr:PAS domain-containing protein [Anaerolineales bacterium]
MTDHTWIKEFPAAITVCDTTGTILAMNDAAAEASTADGGYALIGSNLLDCHPEPARGKLERMLERQEKNIYTIEKNGLKKLIYQTPWYRDGQYAGFVEMALVVPEQLPHFIRQS